MGKFFKGLAQCGAWSCFDEFNRIHLEVLSVCHCPTGPDHPNRYRQKARVIHVTCNCFITMNPGYAGRFDLPDNLKALFRYVTKFLKCYLLLISLDHW